MPRARNFILNSLLPLLLLGSCVVVAGMMGADDSLQSHDTMAKPKLAQASADPALVTNPRIYKGPIEIHTHGIAVPHRQVRIVSEVAGRVITIHRNMRSGMHVTQGTLLLKIDDREYLWRVEELDALIDEKQSELETIERRRQIAIKNLELSGRKVQLRKREYERLQNVAEQNAASLSQLDIAGETLLSAQQQQLDLENEIAAFSGDLKCGAAAIKRMLLQRDQAKLKVEQTEIRVPLDAAVVSASVELGTAVRPGDELLRVEDTGRMEVSCSLSANQFGLIQDAAFDSSQSDPGRLSDGDSITRSEPSHPFELPALPVCLTHRQSDTLQCWRGVLHRTQEHGYDAATRRLVCRILVDDPVSEMGVALMRGMSLDVSIGFECRQHLLAIPKQAVRAGDRVWVTESEKLAVRELYALGERDGALIVRAAGASLSCQTEILLNPPAHPLIGQPIGDVQRVQWPEPAGLPAEVQIAFHSQMQVAQP